MAIWRDGTKIVTKFDPKSTKMDQTSIQNRSKIGLGGSWRPCWLQKPSWIRKGRFVGPLLAPKLGPNLGSCWVKNRHKNNFKIKEDFGSDFGASWADFGGHVVYTSEVGYEKDGSLVHFWAPSWSPSWGHVGSKTDTRTTPKSKKILDRILGRLGPILETMLGPC